MGIDQEEVVKGIAGSSNERRHKDVDSRYILFEQNTGALRDVEIMIREVGQSN